MKTNYSNTENHFNTIFGKKPQCQYEFNLKQMGYKDRRIAECLLQYGVAGKKCLDVGPGTGRWLSFLKENGASYLGAIDVSRESLNHCKGFCDKTQKANFEIDAFSFEPDFFDIIISFEVLEHLYESSNYMSEILRVIKKGGLVLMSVPNIVSLGARLRMLLGHLPLAISADNTHVRFFRKKDVENLFAPHNSTPLFIPTAISLNPLNPKSRFRIPSSRFLSSFDDSLLFAVYDEKN